MYHIRMTFFNTRIKIILRDQTVHLMGSPLYSSFLTNILILLESPSTVLCLHS